MVQRADGQAIARPRTAPRAATTKVQPRNQSGTSLMAGAGLGKPVTSGGSMFNPRGTQKPGQVPVWDSAAGGGSGHYYWDDPLTMPDTTTPTQNPYTTGGGGGRGGGGGGGGAPSVDTGALFGLMNRNPQQYAWQDVDIPEYAQREFYNFDPSRFDQARQGLDTGLAADLQTGNTAYGEAAAGLAGYQNPYAGGQYSTNPAMSDSMRRMLGANGVQADAGTQGQGVQADQAFGNVMALLAGAGQNQQASAARALGGDQRRFQESIQSEGRNMGLGIEMAKAKAMEAYEKEKWQYGEAVAQQNYQARVQEAMANNTGRNQTAQANTQMTNEFNQGNVQALLGLISQGVKIDPAMLQQYMGG